MTKIYKTTKNKDMTGTNTHKYLLCSHDLLCNLSEK